MSVQPSDHTSAGMPWPVCLITSGAIQYGVPRSELLLMPSAVPVVVERRSCWSTLDAPKSASLHTPTESTRTLAPLMSLCIICLPCKYAKPSRTMVMYVRLSDSLKAPKRSSRLAIDPPAQYSRKMLTWPWTSSRSTPR